MTHPHKSEHITSVNHVSYFVFRFVAYHGRIISVKRYPSIDMDNK
jgi:hypothetical protein